MASSPLGRALEFVEAKRFEDAATFLRGEISKDDFGPGETADLCGLLGGVLSDLGRMGEAEAAYRTPWPAQLRAPLTPEPFRSPSLDTCSRITF